MSRGTEAHTYEGQALHFDLDQMLAEGEFVAARWTATRTDGGDLMGIPRPNRRAVTHGCAIGQFKTASRSMIGFTGILPIS